MFEFDRAHLCIQMARSGGITDKAIIIVRHQFPDPIPPESASPNWIAVHYAYQAQRQALYLAAAVDRHPTLSSICPLHPLEKKPDGSIEPSPHGSLVITPPFNSTKAECVKIFSQADI